ncbi:MAG TPA: hypothetical protein GX720_05745 [Clostridiaceae bacterium]|nr:hypothetical protein [Clostridiaceae bacterium]
MTIMMLEASIPVSALITVLLGMSGAVALVALAVLLFRAASALGSITRLVKEISPDIEETVEQLPSIAQNVETISGNLVDMTDDIAVTVPELLEDVETITGAAALTVDSLTALVAGISDSLASLFGGRRRKKSSGANTVQQVITVAGAVMGLAKKGREKSKARKKKKK